MSIKINGIDHSGYIKLEEIYEGEAEIHLNSSYLYLDVEQLRNLANFLNKDLKRYDELVAKENIKDGTLKCDCGGIIIGRDGYNRSMGTNLSCQDCENQFNTNICFRTRKDNYTVTINRYHKVESTEKYEAE